MSGNDISKTASGGGGGRTGNDVSGGKRRTRRRFYLPSWLDQVPLEARVSGGQERSTFKWPLLCDATS